MCKRYYNVKKAKKIDKVLAQIIGARHNGKCFGLGNNFNEEEKDGF